MVLHYNEEIYIYIYLNNKFINRVNSLIYLGIKINILINWKFHINYMINSLSTITTLLYKLNTLLPINLLNDT